MNRIHGSILGLTVLLAVYGVSCTQPKINCTTGHGGFAMKYTLKGAQSGTGDCDKLKGEIVGLEKYNPQRTSDPGHQDFTKATLAVRTSDLGELAAEAEGVGVMDESRNLDSVGDFTSADPDANGVCTVSMLSAATQKLPAFSTPPTDDDPMGKMYPATDKKYEWSNIRVYATTAYPGTQLVAQMTYSDNITGCSATYDVIGLYPAVGCETKVDCSPEADPDAGRATGSGINPDLKDRVDCDPDIHLCVLTAPPESLAK